MRPLLVLTLLFAAQISYAQIRATTESGNKVLLFDDGTWRYDENEVRSVPLTEPVTKQDVLTEVDVTKDAETEATTIFYMQSPRLVRYFGEEKARIRCKLSCSNQKGDIRIHYHWDIQIGDGQRYFGFLRSGSSFTFHMLDGQKVLVGVGEDSKVEAIEKYNKTGISGFTQVLSPEQLSALLAQPVDKMEVDWKKKAETYELDKPNYFMETLPSVF